jgi:hypothetical protein
LGELGRSKRAPTVANAQSSSAKLKKGAAGFRGALFSGVYFAVRIVAAQNSSFRPNWKMRGLWAACGCRKPFHAAGPRHDGSAAELFAPPKQVNELLATPPLPVVLAVELPLSYWV